jgi:Na+/H+ antiporter
VSNPVSTILLLFTAVAALTYAARRLPIPYPTLMVLAGAVFGWIPGLPKVEFESETVLLIFLPPLLYAAAWQMSWRDFHFNLRPIASLAVGLVLATTLAVAVLAHELIDGMSWALAFALGALVAPPDAVAASAVTSYVPLPRRLITIIEGESLVNDATGLVIYRVAIVAAVTGAFSPAGAVIQLVLAPLGGVVIGLVVGWIVVRIHTRLNDPTLESVVTLLTPFAAYLPAEELGASGVLATVSAGIYVSRKASVIFSPVTRLNAVALWSVLVFLLNGLAFILIGLQIPDVLKEVSANSMSEVFNLTVLICLTVIAVRLVLVFPSAFLPRFFSARLRARDPMPPVQELVVLGWAGMRGVVTVAAALALPRVTDSGVPLPHRELLVFVAFAVVFSTLILQGQTLGPLIRWLKVAPQDEDDVRLITDARREITTAALEYLSLSAETSDLNCEIGHLQDHYEHLLSEVLNPRRGFDENPDACSLARVHLGVLDEQRRKLGELGSSGVLPLEVCRRVERELDLEQAHLEESLAIAQRRRA